MTDETENKFFESGDVLDALFAGNAEEKLPAVIDTIASDSREIRNIKEGKVEVSVLWYKPEGSKIGLLSVLDKTDKLFLATFPFFDGKANMLSFNQMLGDQRRWSGFAELNHADEVPMWMFNPFHALSFSALEDAKNDDKRHRFFVSGLCIRLEKSPEKNGDMTAAIFMKNI